MSPAIALGGSGTFADMSKPVNIVAFAALAEAVSEQDGGNWIMIMPAGTFSGRDGRGPFQSGDRAAMQAIVDRTLAHLGRTEMMVDYDHQSFFGAVPKVGGTAPASGWFKEFQVRDDGIYGRVEWTPAAAEKIGALEYRYVSPLFIAGQDQKVVRIDNVALTNTPALDLAAIAAAASRFSATKEDEAMTLLERLAKALGLDASTSEDTLVTTVTAFAAERGKIAEAAGLGKGATADEIVVAMTAQRSADDPNPAEFVPMSMFKDLQGELIALKASGAEAEASDAVEGAIQDGRIPPAQRAWAMSYAKADLKGFKEFLENAPILTSRQRAGDPKPKDGQPKITEADRIAMKAVGVSEADFIAARAKEEI